METKTHWKKLENPDYIGAYSLENGKDLTVEITNVKREMVTGTGGKKEECTIAYLKGYKPMVLNRTNMKTIHKLYDTPYIEEWVGKKITLFIAKIRAFGEDNVECLRIKNNKPVQLPELKESDTVNFDKVVSALKNGYDIAAIKTKWDISKEVETILKTKANETI
jgi:hypothetical protein